MKLKSKRFKKYRSLVILYTVFCILFPYGLMAENSGYKVPKRSISYFVEDKNDSQVEIISPPAAKNTNEADTAVKTDSAAFKTPKPVVKEKTAPKPYVSKRKAVKQTNKDEHFDLSWPDNKKNIKSTKTAIKKPTRKVKKQTRPVISKKEKIRTVTEKKYNKKPTRKIKIKAAPKRASAKQAIVVKAVESEEEEPVFSQALQKMQQRAAERRAEAERLGIVLPSQGGDMASVSPALSKINKTVKTILSRHP